MGREGKGKERRGGEGGEEMVGRDLTRNLEMKLGAKLGLHRW